MANKLYEETYIQNIASRIRAKNGLSTSYTVSEMARAVSAIQTTPNLSNVTVTPSLTSQTISAPSGYDGLSIVTINAIPSSMADPYLPVYKSLAYRQTLRIDSSLVVSWIGELTSISHTQFAEQVFDSGSWYFSNVSTIGQKGFAHADRNGTTASNYFYFPICSSVQRSAFVNYVAHLYIDLPECVSIGSYAFQNATVKSISAPKLQTIADAAFRSCNSIVSIDLPSVTRIGQNAFNSCPSLQTVSLPKLSAVSYAAFENCAKLTDVFLPEVTSLATYAFNQCGSLSTIALPSCEYFGTYAFRSCSNLTSVSAPLLQTIDGSCFTLAAKLETINFPSVTEIKSQAFMSCYRLSNIILPSLISIGNAAFSNCSRLSSIDLPSVTTIAQYAFQACSNLETINLPNVTEIGSSIFHNCKKIRVLSMPMLSEISTRYRFWGQANYYGPASTLQEVNLAGATSIARNLFYSYYSALSSVRLDQLTSLFNSLFYKCTSLTYVSVPSVAIVGSGAFQSCTMLSTISLPARTNISRLRFASCTALESVYLLGSSVCAIDILTTPSTSMPFRFTPIENSSYLGYFGSIYVPSSLVTAYKTADHWSSYADRITAYTG